MYHQNHVCFDCRKVRRASGRATPRCPACGALMVCIGLVSPPPQGTTRQWSALWQAHLGWQRQLLLEVARGEARKNAQHRIMEALIEHRHAATRAGRRQLRRAQRMLRLRAKA